MVNPFGSKNAPFRYLITTRSWPNFGKNRLLRRRPGILQKMGHFYSQLAFETGTRQKYQNVHNSYQNFGEIMVNPFVSKNCHLLELIRAKKFSEFWGKSGPIEETIHVAGNVPFLFAVGVQNGVSSEMPHSPEFYQNFGEVLVFPFSSNNGPFLIANRG